MHPALSMLYLWSIYGKGINFGRVGAGGASQNPPPIWKQGYCPLLWT